MQEKCTPGKSLAPTPEIKTSECLRRLWPLPGMCATRCLLFDNINLTTGLLAELGFLGVVIRTLLTTPRICGWYPNIGLIFLLKCLIVFLSI